MYSKIERKKKLIEMGKKFFKGRDIYICKYFIQNSKFKLKKQFD